MDYLKYYSLEDYLFKEVRKKFKQRNYLNPKEFFCIVIWKANRAKTAIKKKLSNMGELDKVVKDLTLDIYNSKDDRSKLKVLKGEKWRFNLPMATAILTVLYPDRFSVYDVRVRKELKLTESSSVDKYFNEFLPKVKVKGLGKNLRNKDRYLWGKSFYKDLIRFLKK